MRGAQHNIVDFDRIDAGAGNGSRNHMAAEGLRLGVIERTPVSFADCGAGSGNDDGASHDSR